MADSVRKTKFMYWLVRQFPNKFLYYCFMQVFADVTTDSGYLSHMEVPAIPAMDVIKEYGNKYGI